MFRNLILVVVFIICACNEKRASVPNIKMSYYDSTDNSITNLLKGRNLLSLSDSIKWNLYCIYCSDSTSWGLRNKNLPHIPIGFLKLRLLSFTQNDNDTAFFYYRFIYKDSIAVESYDEDRKPIASEVMIKLSTKETMGYGVDFYYSMGKNDRYKHPLQNDIINFIKGNSDKLDDWFRQRAFERRIL